MHRLLSRVALCVALTLALVGSPAQAGRLFHGTAVAGANVIQPGATPFGSWTATATPGAVGNPADYGYSRNVALNFDQPQFQTLTVATYVGVVAFHTPTATDYSNGVTSNMANVECAVDNGAFTTVTAQTTNPQTGVVDYVFLINPALYSDGEHELRCIGTPTTGQPVVLQGAPSESAAVSSLYFNTNANASLPSVTYFVATTGSDSNACSAGSPCLTIYGAIAKYCIATHGSTACNAGADVGGLKVCLAPGSYSFGNAVANINYLAASQWVTIDSCGNSSVIINNVGSTVGLRTAKVHVANLTVNFSATGGYSSFAASLQESQSITPAIWLDTVAFIGAGQAFSNAQPVSAPQTTWTGGAYETTVSITNANNGCIGANLCRDISINLLSSDSFQSSTTVLNSTAQNAGGFYYGPTGVLTGATTGNVALNDWCIRNLSNADPQDFPVGGTIAQNFQGGSFGFFPTNTRIRANDGTGPNGCPVGTVEVDGQATGTATASVFSTGSHPDAYQSIFVASNTIIYGLTATLNISQQGLFIQGGANQIDFAFVNSTIKNDGSLRVMQMAGNMTNAMWINITWGGVMFWAGGTAMDVAIINNNCSAATPAGPLAGVTYRGGAGC